MTSCREFLQLMLDGWLSRDLPRRRLRDCDDHVQSCAQCAAYVASYRATLAALREQRERAPVVQVPEDLVQAILAGGP
ncbi:MAG TPA: hypothetical protein VFZ65_02880 [Planctomycetota bacterium]|nr:hypothetical protein [Planctomycetota bacterium]